jgi:hypothetical protein
MRSEDVRKRSGIENTDMTEQYNKRRHPFLGSGSLNTLLRHQTSVRRLN